jgi:glycosyltransferase involved in cell wall biosynthesis
MKHLVIDARAAFVRVDGLGTYLRQIVPRICAAGQGGGGFRTTVLVNPAMEEFWRGAVPSAEVVPSGVRAMWLGQNWQVPRVVKAQGADLYFYPAHDPPLMMKTPLVFTVHDLSPLQVPHYFERGNWVKTRYLRMVTGRGLRRARAVFAVSNATRRAIGELFGEEWLVKVHVTPNGIVAPEKVSDGGERDRLLYVGTDRPHKNLLRLVEAYANAKAEAPDLPRLDVVGGLRSEGVLRAAMQKYGVAGLIVLRGHVSAEELEACYANAVMLILPSIAEGFGLPILEAMVRGVPVLTSNVSGCAEVAGDAAMTVNPLDVREMAAGIVRLYRDAALRAELIRKGCLRAGEFSWDRTAGLTLEVLLQLLRQKD